MAVPISDVMLVPSPRQIIYLKLTGAGRASLVPRARGCVELNFIQHLHQTGELQQLHFCRDGSRSLHKCRAVTASPECCVIFIGSEKFEIMQRVNEELD
jgi:hypothetical protein